MSYPQETKGVGAFEVYFYPGSNAINPYCRPLKKALQEVSPDIIVLPDALSNLDLRYLAPNPNRKALIHFHWLPELPSDRKGLIRSTAGYWKILAHYLFAESMKFWRGAKVIWTVHHQNRFHLRPFWTKLFFRWTRNLSDGYIFHCESSRTDFMKKYPSEARKPSFIIPHGNFIGEYGPAIKDQKRARSLLNLPDESIIFLILGSIGREKNLKWLMEEFGEFFKDPLAENVKILIAGRTFRRSDRKLLEQKRPNDGLIIIDEFIPDEKFPQFFAAADFLINFHERGYVSGITVAALSYGLPVIQLDRGCAASLIANGENGFIFSPENFRTTLVQAILMKKNQSAYSLMRTQAEERMKNLSWTSIAQKTIAAYKLIAG